MTTSLKTLYDQLCEKRELTTDPAQILALSKLDALRESLVYVHGDQSFRRVLLNTFQKKTSIKGLYIYGPVGRGKSIVMDLFYAHTPIVKKKRLHFHDFMQGVHQKLHAQEKGGKGLPIEKLADGLAEACTLICFDEFMIEHIGDAMILKRLFELLFARGVVMVATSNVAPIDLYSGGFQRELFLPFIETLKAHCETLELAGPEDYRQQAAAQKNRHLFTPLDASSDDALKEIYITQTGSANAPRVIKDKTRTFDVEGADGDMIWVTFEEMCCKPRGAKDYLALSDIYSNWIVSGIPQLTPDQFNEAKRLQTLIDILYERQVKLWMSAASPPSLIYTEGRGLATFQRTVSRLTEMLHS